MEKLRSDVVQHMLEAADARHYSPLFNRSEEWLEFNRWCQASPQASRLITQANERVDSFCLDREAQLYCIAMSMETLDSIVRSLVEAYEDERLELFIR
jgi:hypothetical protein